jgi:RNA polymerase sigma-70 factor (ECF subfamily)
MTVCSLPVRGDQEWLKLKLELNRCVRIRTEPFTSHVAAQAPSMSQTDIASPPNARSETFRTQLVALVPNLRAFAMSLLGSRDRADDLTQETILKAWSHMESFQEGTNLQAWLFTIMRNTFISQCRRDVREVPDPDGLRAQAQTCPPEQEGYVDLQDLHRALAQVPPEQREALILVAGAGFSYEEAAAIVGCPVGTVKSRVNRGRLKLAELLGWMDPSDAGASDAITAAIMAHSPGTSGAMASPRI